MRPEKIIDAEFEVIRPSRRQALGDRLARGLAVAIWVSIVAWFGPKLSNLVGSIMGGG